MKLSTPISRGRARAHERDDLNQDQDQVLVSFPGDYPFQPQVGADHDRHRWSDYFALGFDPDFIRLHMLQVSGLLYQVLVHPLSVASHSFLPVHDRAFVQMKGGDDGLQWTAVRNQSRHDDHQFQRRM